MAQMRKVEDVMTIGCESINEHQTIAEAATKMRALDIGALPICGDDSRLRGVLTDRDIVTRVVGEGLDPRNTEAGQLSNGQTVVAHADDDLDRAIDVMSRKQLRRLPVIDRNDNLVGMLSQSDIATQAGAEKSGEMLARISQPLPGHA